MFGYVSIRSGNMESELLDVRSDALDYEVF